MNSGSRREKNRERRSKDYREIFPGEERNLFSVRICFLLITVSIYRVEVANKKHRARYLPVALERHNSTVLCCCLLKWQPEMGWDEQVCCCSWPGAANVGKVCTDQHREAGEELVTVSLLTMRKIFPNLS